MNINTSSTCNVSHMLHDLVVNKNAFQADTQGLLCDTLHHFRNGLFDDNYDNISRVAPELKPAFIHKSFSHIGMDINEKNIGDALKQCLYTTDITYFGVALVPNSKKAIILTKCKASMKKDEKTRGRGDDNQPKKQAYLLFIELIYKETDQIEN